MKWFFLALILEIILTVRVIGAIGPANYFFYVLISGFVGLFLLRYQQQKLARFAARASDIDFLWKISCGFLGALLIALPGVLTDIVGVLLFIPWFQSRALTFMKTHFQTQFVGAQGPFGFRFGGSWQAPVDEGPRPIRDAEVVEIKAVESSRDKI